MHCREVTSNLSCQMIWDNVCTINQQFIQYHFIHCRTKSILIGSTCLVLVRDASSWSTMLWSKVTTAIVPRVGHRMACTICCPLSSLLLSLFLLFLACRTVLLNTHLPSENFQTLSWPANTDQHYQYGMNNVVQCY